MIKSLSGGSEAFVAEVTTTGSNKAIMKVVMPSVESNSVFEQQITGLKLAYGKGYVRLINYDLNNRAMLVEKLGKPLSEFNYSSNIQMKIICELMIYGMFKVIVVIEQRIHKNLHILGSLIVLFIVLKHPLAEYGFN